MLRKHAILVRNAMQCMISLIVYKRSRLWITKRLRRNALTHRRRKAKTMAAMDDRAIVTTDSEKDIESTATGGSSDKVSPQSGGKLYLMLSCLFDFESGNSIFGASQSRHKNAKTSVHQRFTLCELCSSARSACG